MTPIVLFILALLPFLMTLYNLSEYRTPSCANHRSKISVLIPARDEERNIGAACAAVLANEDVELELIVLDDSSSDGTLDVLAKISDPRLTVVSAPTLPTGWCGKQHACHVLSGLASAELLVFVDADVRLAPDALSRMAGFMDATSAGLASGVPRQILGTWSERLILPLIQFLLLGFLPMALMRQRLDPRFGAGCGQLFIAHRAAYLAAGGHAGIATSIHDGLALPRAFRRAGHQTLLFDATKLAHCRMYFNAVQVWEGLSKNATEAMARPVALPIWTLILGGGQVAPLIMLIFTHGAVAGLAACLGLGTRLILARKFQQPLLSAVLHPVGVAALLLIQWYSLSRAALGGSATWRGRQYVAH